MPGMVTPAAVIVIGHNSKPGDIRFEKIDINKAGAPVRCRNGHRYLQIQTAIRPVRREFLNEQIQVQHIRCIFGILPVEINAIVAVRCTKNGNVVDKSIVVRCKSLVHSAELTTLAFQRGFFGENGQYIVSIGLLLFAFSTAIAWSYYGDRAMTYLLGSRSVMPYRVFYVAAFFWASFADTTLVWKLAAVAIVVMTLPNLFGIMLLRKEMKQEVDDYWVKLKKDNSQEKE